MEISHNLIVWLVKEVQWMFILIMTHDYTHNINGKISLVKRFHSASMPGVMIALGLTLSGLINYRRFRTGTSTNLQMSNHRLHKKIFATHASKMWRTYELFLCRTLVLRKNPEVYRSLSKIIWNHYCSYSGATHLWRNVLLYIVLNVEIVE